jgi:hypothetical protein
LTFWSMCTTYSVPSRASHDCGTWRDDDTVPMITTCEVFNSWDTGGLLLQAANEAVAKNTQASPVATRFNPPRFLRAVP